MTDYNVTGGGIGKYRKTLVAATVDRVIFATRHSSIRVVTDGTAAVYVTTNGTAPTVGGDLTFELPASGGTVALDVQAPGAAPTIVSLISPGAPVYSVSEA